MRRFLVGLGEFIIVMVAITITILLMSHIFQWFDPSWHYDGWSFWIGIIASSVSIITWAVLDRVFP